ncbi:MAG: hypothetical protein CGU28_11180 [Candidatus Dactylopiibacterium carminicum]|uniref:Uncharacterized protein n=1 Tax=Candidatus Dactylopiibacterium carminicum TaxID=857335 RepID=A0A272EST2_9RHOO|nr:hypothetical protein [Candidatus Dactylopiibacterium carminicum]KAF7600757.1 hypothetical protein BGI27_01290 [Candidatus Dactylopiibacterium carminicum]PAS93174.1 MAG: hypothetical protein CGU29_08570 [Candidatus Dactylopiibacterium carminicum]PAS95867.1 MAG: hypothetical protein CGU28_11180 [Candidatus Dactylopiibacterium carminicum]
MKSLLMIPLILLLGACELLGIPDPSKEAAAREAEGRAIGSACRHAGRALEDCFALNASSEKASIFAGWKEMNNYMAENNIPTVCPEITPATQAASAPAAASAPPAVEVSPAVETAPPARRLR